MNGSQLIMPNKTEGYGKAHDRTDRQIDRTETDKWVQTGHTSLHVDVTFIQWFRRYGGIIGRLKRLPITPFLHFLFL